ncbi:MAG: cob(I)yrinic acid a,c-diamide adenosyltransferase [Prevotellaceae bacterium]|jgi:cob(I)alamin adenosyltransferase|nr:cob(I)yrinic acid a,c-diamide adenosyltransferase [Prevotellaceae bacterium]
MKKSIVYTRTGDQGKTSLVGGSRVSKTDVRLEAYGTTDELNAQLGLLLTYLSDEADYSFVRTVQHRLFTIGSYLATDTSQTQLRAASMLPDEAVVQMEREIDRIDEALPDLQAFVLPGGCRAAGVCHVCRTVARRAERRVLALAEKIDVSPVVIAYLNRLSDYLFVLSRKLNKDANQPEFFWEKHDSL